MSNLIEHEAEQAAITAVWEETHCRTCDAEYDGAGDGYDGECPDCADKTYNAEVITRSAPRWAWDLIDETLDFDSRSSAFDAALRERLQKALRAMIAACEDEDLLKIAEDDPILNQEE